MSAASSQTPPRGGYPVEAFARIAAVENGNYWFESRNRLIAWAIQRYFPEARTFLDVGCGTGYVLAGLATACPQLKLAGADFMDEGLEFARRRVPSATFVKMDAQRLDIPEPADVAGSFDVLEHIEEDVSVMKRLREVIRPGGGLLIAVPQHRWLWSSADAQAQHVRRYTRREMVTKLESAGFEVLRVTSFISVLLPLMALSRWRDARKTRGPSASELHVS
ncbi:MAG TPA: methyltransferase domain-containing protein, partial [Vicinamibacterales bacterium]|nr:methyltransferase domain-containing protein [Vicinamibacterales bacterium]